MVDGKRRRTTCSGTTVVRRGAREDDERAKYDIYNEDRVDVYIERLHIVLHEYDIIIITFIDNDRLLFDGGYYFDTGRTVC